jgi:hypothetical protein
MLRMSVNSPVRRETVFGLASVKGMHNLTLLLCVCLLHRDRSLNMERVWVG